MRLFARISVSLFLFFAVISAVSTTSAKHNPGISQDHPIGPDAPGRTIYLPLVKASGYFFVDVVRGSDANPGTSRDQAWKTIQKAADTLRAGATVIVFPGKYNERVKVNRSGTSEKSITFRAEGSVIMKGFTVAADYINIRGFEISNTQDDWRDGVGIFVEGSYCLIEDNYVHYATRGGITLWARPGSEAKTRNCTVKNNRLYRNAMMGIDVSGRNHLIEGNEIWGTIQYHPLWSNPPDWVDADGISFFGSGHTIRKNYIHDITYRDPENVNPHIDCFQTWGNANAEAAQDVLFEQNLCRNLEVQSPYENGQGFMMRDTKNITIRNNIIQAYRIVNAFTSDHLTIINNTFTGDLSLSTSSSPMGVSLSGTPNSIIKNNIFFNIPGRAVFVSNNSTPGLDVSYNCIYRSDGVTPAGLPYPNDLWQVKPFFVNPTANDFHLQDDSPLVDAGITLPDITNDYDGAPRPKGKGYDLGAYER